MLLRRYIERIKIFFMNTNPRVSLIFVNYRSARYLFNALESLFSFEQERNFFEVIIVNNDVSERSALEALERSFPIRLIENGRNSGFGEGSNIGAKQARGEFLGFINPDILWTGICLSDLIGAFDEKIGVLGMQILSENKEEEAWSAGKEPSLAGLFCNNVFPCRRAYWRNSDLSFPDWVSGGALFIRKDLFFSVGGFDKRFFLYFEDVDLCKKVRNYGHLVARYAKCSLIHLGGKSISSKRFQKKCFYDSQKKYFEKYRPVWENKLLGLLHFLFCRI